MKHLLREEIITVVLIFALSLFTQGLSRNTNLYTRLVKNKFRLGLGRNARPHTLKES